MTPRLPAAELDTEPAALLKDSSHHLIRVERTHPGESHPLSFSTEYEREIPQEKFVSLQSSFTAQISKSGPNLP